MTGAVEIDKALHAARHDRHTGQKRTFRAPAKDLPSGAFLVWNATPHLVQGGHALPYVQGRYLAPVDLPEAQVDVLTPEPLIAVMRAGWTPALTPADDRPNW